MRKNKDILLASILLLLLTLSIYPIYSHVAGGKLKIVDNYRIQLTIVPENLERGSNASFVFSIQDLELRHVENITIISLQLVHGEKGVIYSVENLFQEYGDFSINTTIPYDGEYSVLLRFRAYDDVVDVDFRFSVGGNGLPREYILLPIAIIALLSVILLTRRFRAGRTRKSGM